ncbi:putative translation elongation factor EFTs/EF1B, S1 domain, nucleic acid-binding protein [Helianthus anomalus]
MSQSPVKKEVVPKVVVPQPDNTKQISDNTKQIPTGIHIAKTLATGVDVDVSVEQQADQLDSTVSGQDSGQASKPTSTVDKSKQRSRPVREGEMPPMKDEELVLGATFTGKVRSIQPFGAFVDFGAFTDGLVHVSQLSDGYVKDVSSVVSVGQEVKVKLVEANIETGRITMTMRENESSRNTGQKSNPRRDRDEGIKVLNLLRVKNLKGL